MQMLQIFLISSNNINRGRIKSLSVLQHSGAIGLQSEDDKKKTFMKYGSYEMQASQKESK